MDSELSLLSINIEGRKHLNLVLPFIKKHMPDVLLLQEICRQDLPLFEEVIGTKGHFVPMTISEKWGRDEQGIAIFTKLPHTQKQHLYAGHEGEVIISDIISREASYKTMSYWLMTVEVEKEEKKYNVATTHFPVTEGGEPTWYQEEALTGLLETLSSYNEIILAGDMNAPRGKVIFTKLADMYKDNVPAKYTTSIDGNIHRAGPIPFVVDVLFTTDEYLVRDFEYISGVSDHYAISAKISKVK